MPKVLSVRFRTAPKTYFFAPIDGEEYSKGDRVVVETQRGEELAIVVSPVTEVDEDRVVSPLKPVIRLATEDDLKSVEMPEEKRQEIISVAKQKVAARGLDMKIVDCEYALDRAKLVLYFTAEQRVDFRELVRDLASAFRMRIDLRQIGARDECKLIGSLGACGLPCCCGRFASDSEHVSIKMAKCQNLALTPNKINGMCGRLLCCLAYENATYEDVAKRSPKIGSWVSLSDGRRGAVVSVTPLTETVRVKIGDEENFEFVDVALSDITFDRAALRPDGGKKQKPKQEQPKEEEQPQRQPKDKRPKKDRRPQGQPNGAQQNGQGGQNNGGQNNGKKKKHKHNGKPNKPKTPPPSNGNE